jgi:anti-sigma factor RsiW
MTCKEAAPFIARFADAAGSLDEATRATINAHVQACASCRTALETQRSVAAWLRSRPADELSPEFSARLAQRLDEASGWFGIADWRVWTLRLAPVAAALALAILLGSDSTAPSTITVEDWAIEDVDTSSPVSLLSRPDVTPESLMQTMLTGELPSTGGETGNVR